MAARMKACEESKVELKKVQALKQMCFKHPVRQVDLKPFKHSWSVPEHLRQSFALLQGASPEDLYEMLEGSRPEWAILTNIRLEEPRQRRAN